MKKEIIFSYDYELFFGKDSGTVEKSIIYPTNKILGHLEKYGYKGNFFVDWQMLKYIKETNTQRNNDDYRLLENQIKDIVARGHRIELHIHPHWVDAKYIGEGKWDFSNFSHYSLWSFTEEDIANMFVEGKQLLESIARTVIPDYTIVAFRAGGWAVQPFDNLKRAFLEVGIKVDSSVAYGANYKCDYSYYDFRGDVIKDLSEYRFTDDVMKPVSDGDFLEIPISTYKRHLYHKISDRIYRIVTKRSYPITDGTHARDDLKATIVHTKMALITISKRSPLTVLLGVLSQKDNLVTIIDHPKDYSISNKDSFALLSHFVKSTTYKEVLER